MRHQFVILTLIFVSSADDSHLRVRSNNAASEFIAPRLQRCVPIDIPLCMHMPYNMTSAANLVATNPINGLEQYNSLIERHKDNAKLKFFMCSAYLPMCTDQVAQPIGPCRPLCEQVQRSIEPTLNNFGASWQTIDNGRLACSNFHAENNAEAMCMSGHPLTDDDDVEPKLSQTNNDHISWAPKPASDSEKATG
jgi:hypothetical protein